MTAKTAPFDGVYHPRHAGLERPLSPVAALPFDLRIDPRRGRLFTLPTLFKGHDR